MYKEGDWIIDKKFGLPGVVLRVYPDGVTARFGGMTAIRANHNIEFAPVEIHDEDLHYMQHLAVETGDYEWFCELGARLGATISG
jgi:hypothetical protein